ncbi:MAG: hypothetical protein FJ045_04565, partial [Crenarchaeota archaeon]|nr:hypothetical protein [Thermoproteota archaeon]
MSNKCDLNSWLSYSIVPQELSTHLRPAMWGNGQIEVLAELDRPSVSEAVCFGFGQDGLAYQSEEHLVPAVYDAVSGEKYFLSSTTSSTAQRTTVTFRPDRQIWHYEFDELNITVSLILPRMLPGYLFKAKLSPKKSNKSQKWIICQELRRTHGGILFATEAEYDLRGSKVWCRDMKKHGEAIGATSDAESINLGKDGAYATDIMAKICTERDRKGSTIVYIARAFGATPKDAKDGLMKLLTSPER